MGDGLQRAFAATKATRSPHDRRLACRDYVLSALIKAMERRHEYMGIEWVSPERMAVAVAANEWATANAPAATVTVDDVERVEQMAVGHSDYATKLALYVAELVTRSGRTTDG